MPSYSSLLRSLRLGDFARAIWFWLRQVGVVLEERDVVGRRLDAKDPAKLVVHLDRGRPHVMLDPGPLDALLESGAEFVFEVAVDVLAPEEARDVVGLDGVNRRADEGLVVRLQILARAEDDVGGVLDLHDAPVVAEAEFLDDGTAHPGVSVERLVQIARFQVVGKSLRSVEVGNRHESVVAHLVGDAGGVELASEDVVPVEVELEAKRAPGRHAYVAEAKCLVDEVEVVVQALPRRTLQIGAPRFLVVPGPIRRTAFHRRQDEHEARMVPTRLQCLLDEVLLSGPAPGDELDGNLILPRDSLGIGAHCLRERLNESRIVEQTNATMVQERAHTAREAQRVDRPLDQDAVVAGQRSDDAVGVTFEQ